MSEDYTPCPFCNSTDLGNYNMGYHHWVRCMNCGVSNQSGMHDNYSAAIAAWNSRAGEGEYAALITEMAFKIGESDMGLSLHYMDKLAALKEGRE